MDKDSHLDYFKRSVGNAYEYAVSEKKAGKKIVGIMCEYTPRELLMAAGCVPVCLCGGSLEMIAPAEKELPANLCPIIKSTYGYSIEKSNPFLEMADLLVAETTCDGKKKMYELLSLRHPMYVLELPQKSRDADAFDHWVKELKKLRTFLEKTFNVKITNEKIKKAIAVMNKERKLKRALAELMKSEIPSIKGRELLELKSLISGIPEDLAQYENIYKVFKSQEDRKELSDKVRVLLTGVPLPHGAERVMDIIEAGGAIVVAQENCTGLKPLDEDVNESDNDPIMALAEKYFHLPCSVMTKNNDRMKRLKELANEYRAECVIELVWQTCITYDIESALVKKMTEEELDLPYLRIETDYSPSDTERLAMRIQALVETVNNKK
ncbi:MAG: 2-hydroxyacyl-CoA dehydratase [Candidatus Omnitrophica bacterium]|nr:2-hydroxyacyl-CoA dehydratase [Candidatus Omnitrophota bacterium]